MDRSEVVFRETENRRFRVDNGVIGMNIKEQPHFAYDSIKLSTISDLLTDQWYGVDSNSPEVPDSNPARSTFEGSADRSPSRLLTCMR